MSSLQRVTNYVHFVELVYAFIIVTIMVTIINKTIQSVQIWIHVGE
jgi:hypothetical protein